MSIEPNHRPAYEFNYVAAIRAIYWGLSSNRYKEVVNDVLAYDALEEIISTLKELNQRELILIALTK